jgi:hypothetical protein
MVAWIVSKSFFPVMQDVAMDRRAPLVCVQEMDAHHVLLWRRLTPSVIAPATQVQFPMVANVRAGFVASHLSSWPSPASKLKHVDRAHATEGATRNANTRMVDGFMDLRPKVGAVDYGHRLVNAASSCTRAPLLPAPIAAKEESHEGCS